MQPWERFQFRSQADRPPADSALAAFQNRIGADLPGDYRSFLRTVNGGRPVGPEGTRPDEYLVLDVDWQGRPPAESDDVVIVDFLLIAADGCYTDFVVSEPRLPAGMVPIGRDPGASLFLMTVGGKQHGSVWFWTRDWFDRDAMTSAPFHNAALLAPSFSDFIGRIALRSL